VYRTKKELFSGFQSAVGFCRLVWGRHWCVWFFPVLA